MNASMSLLFIAGAALLAVLLLAAIIVIAVLLSRSRRRDEEFGQQFLRPEPPAPNTTGLASRGQATGPLQHDTVPLMPFDKATQQDYERLAAETFQSPPAAPLGQSLPPEPFSWTAAVRGDEQDRAAEEAARSASAAGDVFAWEPAEAPPAPASDPGSAFVTPPPVTPVTPATPATSATPATTRDDAVPAAPAARAETFDWVLVMPDGEKLPLQADTVLGRRVDAPEGAYALSLEDPTRTVSKVHARLRFVDGRWTIEDLGSTNGVVLLLDNGGEQVLPQFTQVPAVQRMLLGTLLVRLQRDESAGR